MKIDRNFFMRSSRLAQAAVALLAALALTAQAGGQEAAISESSGSGLHIIPDHVGDSHFTAGPCPDIVPPDGATCPNGATTCPAFYNPALLPAGYDSVSYCASIPGVGFNSPGYTLLTKPLTTEEQESFLKAAKKLESYVKDNVTVVIEPYKVDYLDSGGNSTIFFYGNEYWNPVCGADALLPPFTSQTPTIVENPDTSYSYQNLPQTYDTVLAALKHKNAANESPMKLMNYLPSYSQIDVEWPPTFFGWEDSTDVASDLGTNFLVQNSENYPVTPGSKPFTLCSSPSAMKMLGLSSMFKKNGHTIDDINSPAYNMNVTLAGTDSALVIPDAPSLWMYDSTAPSVTSTQLPKAFYETSYNWWIPQQSCDDPTVCQLPAGANPGVDLIGVFNHELNHVLGLMQSQYYKVQGEGTSLAYTYGTALFPLDLFDLDSDFVVPGYGAKGIETYSDFTSAPRNNNTYEPTTILDASSADALTPFVQYGMHDHLMVYGLDHGQPQAVPLMNDSIQNPDGDIQLQSGNVVNYVAGTNTPFFVDPELVNLDPLDVVYPNVQSGGSPNGTIYVDTIREYSELAANGWNIKYSTLKNAYDTVSPVAKWYETCFNSAGVFTTSKNSHCKFSVVPADLKFLNAHFDMAVEPSNQIVKPGGSPVFLLRITSQDTFSGKVYLSCSGGPAGSKCALSQNAVQVNSSANVAALIEVPEGAKPGTYTVSFTGKAGSLTVNESGSFTLK